MDSSKKIGFIGAGNMSKAIITGLVNKGYNPQLIMASNPSQAKLDALHNSLNIHISNDNQALIDFADIVVLSVKPQLMEAVCENLSAKNQDQVFVSIAAGINVKRLQDFLPEQAKIVRVMPNTPSAIGLGMSGIFAQPEVPSADVEYVANIMQSVGKTLIVKNESDINSVIAAAGSSPAYFFLIAQAMQEATMAMGISKSDARILVEQAMLGSATLMASSHELELSELRANVTSKGGTTAQAIASLQNDKIEGILAKAMQAAVDRAEEMSKQF